MVVVEEEEEEVAVASISMVCNRVSSFFYISLITEDMSS